MIDPDELRHTLEEFFDEAAFLSPHGLRAVSKRYENNPYTLEGVAGRVDRLRAGRVDHDACSAATRTGAGRSGCRSTTSRSASSSSTSASSATTSSSSTRPARASERTFGEIAQDLADRLISIWLPGADGRRPLYGGTERLQTRPGLEGQPHLQRVLPRRQRRRPRRDAPDRLDGARRRPDPRPAASGCAARPRPPGRVRGRRPVGRAAAARCSAREGVA